MTFYVDIWHKLNSSDIPVPHTRFGLHVGPQSAHATIISTGSIIFSGCPCVRACVPKVCEHNISQTAWENFTEFTNFVHMISLELKVKSQGHHQIRYDRKGRGIRTDVPLSAISSCWRKFANKFASNIRIKFRRVAAANDCRTSMRPMSQLASVNCIAR